MTRCRPGSRFASAVPRPVFRGAARRPGRPIHRESGGRACRPPSRSAERSADWKPGWPRRRSRRWRASAIADRHREQELRDRQHEAEEDADGHRQGHARAVGQPQLVIVEMVGERAQPALSRADARGWATSVSWQSRGRWWHQCRVGEQALKGLSSSIGACQFRGSKRLRPACRRFDQLQRHRSGAACE